MGFLRELYIKIGDVCKGERLDFFFRWIFFKVNRFFYLFYSLIEEGEKRRGGRIESKDGWWVGVYIYNWNIKSFLWWYYRKELVLCYFVSFLLKIVV